MRKKNTRKKPYKKNAPAKTQSLAFLWLGMGIAIGLFIAAIFYFKTSVKNSYSHSVSKLDLLDNDVKEPTISKHKAHLHKQHSKTKPIAQNSQYDFYNMLSTQEEPIRKETTLPAKKIVHENKKITLKIASFKKFEEADALKAQLALMGFHVSISKIKGNPMLYHVVSGPFQSQKEAIKMQEALKTNNVSSTLD